MCSSARSCSGTYSRKTNTSRRVCTPSGIPLLAGSSSTGRPVLARGAPPRVCRAAQRGLRWGSGRGRRSTRSSAPARGKSSITGKAGGTAPVASRFGRGAGQEITSREHHGSIDGAGGGESLERRLHVDGQAGRTTSVRLEPVAETTVLVLITVQHVDDPVRRCTEEYRREEATLRATAPV